MPSRRLLLVRISTAAFSEDRGRRLDPLSVVEGEQQVQFTVSGLIFLVAMMLGNRLEKSNSYTPHEHPGVDPVEPSPIC